MGKFVIKQTAKGYKFNLLAANGQVIAASEVYKTEAACRKGVQSVTVCAPTAHIADLTGEGKTPPNPKFELYKDKADQYRFRLKARNGQIIAVSEGYTSRSACENGIDSVRKNAADATVEQI